MFYISFFIVKLRITGTTNISKITKSMKMVSAAKLRGDQTRLAAAKPFSQWAESVTGKQVLFEDLPSEGFPQKNLFVVCSSDKGLCGGVNTILTRMMRQMVARLNKEGKEYKIYVLGDKGRAQLRRLFEEDIVACSTERIMPYGWDLACSLSKDALSNDYDSVHIVYNEFKSAIAYLPMIKTITPLVDPNSAFLHPYDVEPANDRETLQNFHEFTMATQIFHSILDNATSEQSSRMNAMENASKNASEMIGKLTLQYNRARQARITTELIEIISGASALKG
jgi:F-type H+-transporting ATPase subunit gamma